MGHKTLSKDNIPVGTWGNKYDSKNKLKDKLLDNFLNKIIGYISDIKEEISDIHEIGTGEGHVARLVNKNFPDIDLKASDYAEEIIKMARKASKDLPIDFSVKDIYNLSKEVDSADLIMCCEVLEHLEDPQEALNKISSLNAKYFILSVPNEPIWRILQFASGNNIKDLGNTPGHINHWSSSKFISLVSEYLDVIKFNSPLPWTVLLAKKKQTLNTQ